MPQSGRKSANKSGTTEALAFVSCLNGRDEGFFYTHICEEKTAVAGRQTTKPHTMTAGRFVPSAMRKE
jgi:hypothetical protein